MAGAAPPAVTPYRATTYNYFQNSGNYLKFALDFDDIYSIMGDNEENTMHDKTTLTETCGSEEAITVETKDLHDWKNGTVIQEAMPYLNSDQREMMISHTCSVCWDKLFPEDSD